jgi:hypothetical protein
MARFVTCDRCGLRSVVRVRKLNSTDDLYNPVETLIIDCPSCGIHEAELTNTPAGLMAHSAAGSSAALFENRFASQPMQDWQQVVSEIAERGWTLTIAPTGMPIGVMGTVVIMNEYDPDNDAPEIMEAVGVDDIRSDSQALLNAILRLCRRLDPSF